MSRAKRCASSEGGLDKVPWMSILILLGNLKWGKPKQKFMIIWRKKNIKNVVEVIERLTITFWWAELAIRNN